MSLERAVLIKQEFEASTNELMERVNMLDNNELERIIAHILDNYSDVNSIIKVKFMTNLLYERKSGIKSQSFFKRKLKSLNGEKDFILKSVAMAEYKVIEKKYIEDCRVLQFSYVEKCKALEDTYTRNCLKLKKEHESNLITWNQNMKEWETQSFWTRAIKGKMPIKPVLNTPTLDIPTYEQPMKLISELDYINKRVKKSTTSDYLFHYLIQFKVRHVVFGARLLQIG